tara:strand:- start:41 stop:331 length:291 start_codon:yes stop_codon:yes gene_type:complete
MSKLLWGGELNTKILRNAKLTFDEGDEGGAGGGGTGTYQPPAGNTQNYTINQVLVTPVSITSRSSITIMWSGDGGNETQEVDAQEQYYEDLDFGGS